jgi:hypothetical protein
MLATLNHYSSATIHSGAASTVLGAVMALGALAALAAALYARHVNGATDRAMAFAEAMVRLDVALRVKAARDAYEAAKRDLADATTLLVVARLDVHCSASATEARAQLGALSDIADMLRISHARKVASRSRKVA